MSDNPYAPPKSKAFESSEVKSPRTIATRRLRLSCTILLVPAFYNLVCFAYAPKWNRVVLPYEPFGRFVNTFAFGITAVIVWWWALNFLEAITAALFRIFARRSQRSDWLLELYVGLRPAPYVALAGAVVWFLWITAFYTLGIYFYEVSIPASIAGNLLGARLYVPLAYRWYMLERNAADQAS